MKYISNHNGQTTGAESGEKIKYRQGEPFEAAKGDVDHVAGIEPVEDPKADNAFEALSEGTEFPYHKGGGYYFLSNGDEVRGKENAQEAQAELDG